MLMLIFLTFELKYAYKLYAYKRVYVNNTQSLSTLISKLSTQKNVGMISSATGSMGRMLSSFDFMVISELRICFYFTCFWVADAMPEFVDNLNREFLL